MLPDPQREALDRLRPLCEEHELGVAGGWALRLHGLDGHAGPGLSLVTAAETPLPALAGLVRATVPEAGCEVRLAREPLLQPLVRREGVLVAGLDDVAGLKVRALAGRGLPRDVTDVAAAARVYACRALEELARARSADFSVHELRTRLEFVELMADEEFGAPPERVAEIRRFALGWIEEIQLRRAEEGDIDVDDPGLPEVD
ncbi:hypothetical protein [Nonomuraea sp. NPDC050310]|uniref:hypothetical protein n=1 Tax=Nonomuraea sp. NPDC050310 TaxID=3154935 RepID=UPI0033D37A24